jgi:hypothetical protein
MAKRRTGSKPGETRWLEWLDRLDGRPVGSIGAGVVVAGWIVLALLYLGHVWTIEVVFFIAVGLLTFVLGCLSLYAALVQVRRSKPTAVLKLPESWKDFEEYSRWLTPVGFMFGLIFAHYFWH